LCAAAAVAGSPALPLVGARAGQDVQRLPADGRWAALPGAHRALRQDEPDALVRRWVLFLVVARALAAAPLSANSLSRCKVLACLLADASEMPPPRAPRSPTARGGCTSCRCCRGCLAQVCRSRPPTSTRWCSRADVSPPPRACDACASRPTAELSALTHTATRAQTWT
jgi:hypothetical protein